MRTLLPIIALASGLSFSGLAQSQHPSLFRDLDFNAGQAAAKQENKLLLLDAMTTWCGPCKVMDKSTWVDPKIEAWVGKNAVAIQLDMDIHTAVKDATGIAAFPTMILFRPDGTEFDRVVGLRKPGEMLTWLNGALEGEREIDRVRADLEALAQSGEPKTRERMSLAFQAADVGATQEASAQVEWLWDRQPATEDESRMLLRWRTGSGRNLTGELLQSNKDLQAEIARQRTDREANLKVAEDFAMRSEWFALNQALGDLARTTSWASIQAISPEGRTVLQEHDHVLFDLLVDQSMWAAAGHTLRDPLERIQFLGDNLGAYDVQPKPTGNGTKTMPAIPMNGMTPAPKTIPAIPLGGMQPAQPTKSPTDKAIRPEDAKSKSIPMIPLGGMAPATPIKTEAKKGSNSPTANSKNSQSIPMIPLTGTQPAQPVAQDEKTIPAIPLGGMKPAQPANSAGQNSDAGKAIPMIPMGGMQPASPAGSAESSARPEDSTGAPESKTPQRPETPEGIAREVRSRLTHQLRRSAARRYGALLAANRLAEAEAVANSLLGYANDDMARAALVSCALQAGKIDTRRAAHLAWLDSVSRGAGR